MDKYVINKSTLVSIGDAIRSKTGKVDSIPVTALASSISALEVSEGGFSFSVFAPTDSNSLTLTEEMINAKYIVFGSYNSINYVDMKSLNEDNYFSNWKKYNYSNSKYSEANIEDFGMKNDNGLLKIIYLPDGSNSNMFYSKSPSTAWIAIFS